MTLFSYNKDPIILASQSPARLELLKRINILPDAVMPANIDESEHRKELPAGVASRLANQKAIAIADKIESGIIIAADTVVAKGRRILPKALNAADVRYCLEMLSGCRHRLYTGVCVIKKSADGELIIRKRLVQTVLRFKRLTKQEIDLYCNLGEGINCAGGYAIGGYAEAFLEFISGSHSNVIGLPLMETLNMLNSLGVRGNLNLQLN